MFVVSKQRLGESVFFLRTCGRFALDLEANATQIRNHSMITDDGDGFRGQSVGVSDRIRPWQFLSESILFNDYKRYYVATKRSRTRLHMTSCGDV